MSASPKAAQDITKVSTATSTTPPGNPTDEAANVDSVITELTKLTTENTKYDINHEKDRDMFLDRYQTISARSDAAWKQFVNPLAEAATGLSEIDSVPKGLKSPDPIPKRIQSIGEAHEASTKAITEFYALKSSAVDSAVFSSAPQLTRALIRDLSDVRDALKDSETDKTLRSQLDSLLSEGETIIRAYDDTQDLLTDFDAFASASSETEAASEAKTEQVTVKGETTKVHS